MEFANKLQRMLERDEGIKDQPYFDSEGHLTIGIGHNLDEPLAGVLIEAIFRHDLRRHTSELLQRWPFIEFFDDARKAALINMAFQMGVPRLATFRKMFAALEVHDWKLAHAEALDSKWALQTPERAKRVSEQLLTGRWV